MRNRGSFVARASLVLGSWAGCVPSEQYETTLADLARAREAVEGAEQKRVATEQELAACKEEIASVQAQSSEDLAEQRQSLEQELAKLRAANEKQRAAFQSLRDKLKGMIDSGDLDVYVRRGRMIIAMPSRVLFPSGKAELSKPGERALTRVLPVLKELNGQRFEVAGHTDDVPVGEKLEFKDNWELSSARAITVTHFLVAQGLEPKNLSVAGYSEFDPVSRNRSPNGRQRNRRMELILVPDLSALPGVLEDTAEDE